MSCNSKIISFAVGLALASELAGCSGRKPAPEAAPAPNADQLLATGRRLARQGNSLRAEQYLLAAMDAGIQADQAFPLLVSTCIRSGRYRSALMHVESRLLEMPDDLALRELSRTLRVSLGLPERGLEP